MLDMPIRAGKRIQDVQINIREKMARRTGERQQTASLHRQRMSCSDSVKSFTNTQDWTGGMGISPSGRFQVIEEAARKPRLGSGEGIRWDAAWIAIGLAIAICVVVLLADVAGMGLGSRSISKLESKIEDMNSRNETLRQELALSSGDVSVCTEAVKLNLISGYGATTITLTAPSELSAGAVTMDVRGAANGWTSSAGIGD